MGNYDNIDVTANITNIENLKTDILMDIALINKALTKNDDININEYLANIIINSYILSNTLSQNNYDNIEEVIKNKIRSKILKEDRLKNDYIKLAKHLQVKK